MHYFHLLQIIYDNYINDNINIEKSKIGNSTIIWVGFFLVIHAIYYYWLCYGQGLKIETNIQLFNLFRGGLWPAS